MRLIAQIVQSVSKRDSSQENKREEYHEIAYHRDQQFGLGVLQLELESFDGDYLEYHTLRETFNLKVN